jgi:uncharacterized protein
MARIERNRNAPLYGDRSRGKAPRSAGASPPSFHRLIESSSEVSAAGAGSGAGDLDTSSLESMLDGIHQRGEELLKRRTMQSLKAYREAVQRFLRQVVGDGLGIREQESGSSIATRKRYTIITVVNDRLERLVHGLMQSQDAQFSLLERVEEIQGLLVDLSH